MKKKLISFLFSMLFTGILLVIFAISIGYATFIENDYGTITAKILVYNSRWFEALLVVVCINLLGSIFVNKLISRKKWTIFLFHVAFIFIIIGAAVTRYYGYEGTMHIREGESSAIIVSDFTVVTTEATSGGQTVSEEKEVKFSPYTANRFSKSLSVNGQTIHIKNLQFMPSATETVVADPTGSPIVSLIAVGADSQRRDFNLSEGDIKQTDGVTLGLNSGTAKADIHFTLMNGVLMVSSVDSITISSMGQNNAEVIPARTTTEISTQKVYSSKGLTFAVRQFLQRGKSQLIYSQPQEGRQTADALQMLVTVGNESKEIIVYGQKGIVGEPVSAVINGINVSVSYGSKVIGLPFSIHLADFQLERYPGSNSPSSYASEVVVKDGSFEKPFRIYMNNILKYQGYRFFQSSYDTDEQGTILSVNHDSAGTSITYFGYLIMVIGMVLTLFNKNSRFKTLLRVSAKLREERKKLFVVLVLGFVFTFYTHAQNSPPLDKNHVSEFEELIIQSYKGRVEPVSTLASEIMRKVAKKNSWDGKSPAEVFLDMQANPEKWKNIPFIKVANPELRKMLGTTDKYVAFNTIVAPREMGGYRLSAMVSAAYEKSSSERNKLDKEIINVDERVNILMNVFTGSYLTIFPVPGDENHKWVSVTGAGELDSATAGFARQTISSYLNSVNLRDWATANQLLETLKNNQQKYGSKIIPSETKTGLEVLYNNLNIFGKLSKILMFTGLILLFVQLLTLFNPAIKLTGLKKAAFVFILLLFLVETAGPRFSPIF